MTIASKDEEILKSCKISIPKITPPNKDAKTFLVYSAINIAKRDGKRERLESSIDVPKTH